VIFTAVGTPPGEDYRADLSAVEAVSRAIGSHMTDYRVIVNKSTVPVGTAQKVKKWVQATQKTPIEFDVVSNPEFLREGSALEDFMRPNRVVIGAESQKAFDIMRELYDPLYLLGTPMLETNLESSELIKYAANAFLATKISFINEIANLCEKVGANIKAVAKGIGLDNRIGSKFLHAGAGYGGSCFPKDTLALTKIAEEAGYECEIVNTVIKVNAQQRIRILDKIRKALNHELKGKNIAVLGLSFKPNTDDMRESPAVEIINAIRKDGAYVKAFDPEAMEEARHMLSDLEYCNNTYDAVKDCDLVVFMTEWNEFRNVDWINIKRMMRDNKVVDARNIFDPERIREMGFTYDSVGRP